MVIVRCTNINPYSGISLKFFDYFYLNKITFTDDELS